MSSVGVVKRHSKNDFMYQQTPCMTCPMRHGNTIIISKMGPMIVMGSVKAQGLKAKPIDGSELPRATRARDKATQRVANILAHPVPHLGDPSSSSIVSESRSRGFLHAPL
jgi:hypothetical protein